MEFQVKVSEYAAEVINSRPLTFLEGSCVL